MGTDDDRPPVHRRDATAFEPGEQLPVWFACSPLRDHRSLVARRDWVYCPTCDARVAYSDVIDRRTGEVSASAPAFL